MNRLKGMTKVWLGEAYSNKLRETILLYLIILIGIIISNIVGA